MVVLVLLAAHLAHACASVSCLCPPVSFGASCLLAGFWCSWSSERAPVLEILKCVCCKWLLRARLCMIPSNASTIFAAAALLLMLCCPARILHHGAYFCVVSNAAATANAAAFPTALNVAAATVTLTLAVAVANASAACTGAADARRAQCSGACVH